MGLSRKQREDVEKLKKIDNALVVADPATAASLNQRKLVDNVLVDAVLALNQQAATIEGVAAASYVLPIGAIVGPGAPIVIGSIPVSVIANAVGTEFNYLASVFLENTNGAPASAGFDIVLGGLTGPLLVRQPVVVIGAGVTTEFRTGGTANKFTGTELAILGAHGHTDGVPTTTVASAASVTGPADGDPMNITLVLDGVAGVNVVLGFLGVHTIPGTVV